MGACSRQLNSEKFYNILDDNSPSIAIYHPYCEIISADIPEYHKIMKVCYKVVNFLMNNPQKKDKKISCIRCKLLNYWVYDKIKSICDAVKESNLIVVYGYIQTIMSGIIRKEYDSNDNLCHLDPQVPYDKNWKAKKEFYEYCYDYNIVKLSNMLRGYVCTKYQNYLEKKTELYNNYDKILSDTNLNKCTYSYEEEEEEGEEEEEKKDKCDPNVLLEELIRKKEDSASGQKNLTGDSSISFLGLPDKRTASTAASVAGVSLLGLALYKFTPLSTWIHRGNRRMNSVTYNLDGGDTNQLFSHISQSPDMNHEDASYFLSYNSA